MAVNLASGELRQGFALESPASLVGRLGTATQVAAFDKFNRRTSTIIKIGGTHFETSV